jgi:hypothetical protein
MRQGTPIHWHSTPDAAPIFGAHEFWALAARCAAALSLARTLREPMAGSSDRLAFGTTDLFEGTASGRNLALSGGEIGGQAECLGGAEHSLSQLFDRPHLELPDPLA